MSVTAPAGFTAAGVAAGIKRGGALDVALVVGPPGTTGAAVFTTNRIPAAPVVVSRRHLAAGSSTRAVILNSGCANAATGGPGERVATATAERVAAAVGCDTSDVIVCSTGPIGTTLDEDAVLHGVDLAAGKLDPGPAGGDAAANAIMTTDSVPKQALRGGPGFTVGGMAKGAGMIRPDMATMLAVLTTDAVVDPVDLGAALHHAVAGTFNALDIDGCQSTNDTVVVLASGQSGTPVAGATLATALSDVCRDLARQIAADAEGAGRVVTVRIAGATHDREALRLARAVADSALVRASFSGGDPNWGRIVGALGAAGVDLDPGAICIAFGDVVVAAGGVSAGADEDALAAQIVSGDFTVDVTMGTGDGTASVLTTDLTVDYVTFNAERS